MKNLEYNNWQKTYRQTDRNLTDTQKENLQQTNRQKSYRHTNRKLSDRQI